jgi:uncharacterized protein (TIGR03067 family)
MLRVPAVLLAVASAALAAPVPKAVKARGKTLEGTWEATSMTMNGRDIIQGNTSVWVIRGDTLVRNSRGPDGSLVPSNPNLPIEFKADPDRPGELDYTDRNGGQANLWRALYEVNGDEFTISFGDLNADRPAELKEGVGVYFYKFKRVEEKK